MATPDLYEILANLDFLVLGPKTRSLQDKDFGEYENKILIQIAEGLHNQFTVDEVREQLWEAFRFRESFPEYAFDLLFLHGSSEFDLNREEREHIATHLDTIRLRKACAQTLRNDTLRSRSIALAPVQKQEARSTAVCARLLSSSHKTRNKPVGRCAVSKSSKSPKVGALYKFI
ncbi:hypothetical protein BU25DRAFT_166423 [Macroventuria anomochaeta]|uniref:Uncharacterized protein n=1 Tax=Macroventuria anomochaeta TaxID=301207 RepID=A0ACB6RQ28_9PLEO|nr:uncharacterized protein BU25DRAFT_166423 [Macroventuria anomochaeta]KAF2624065.1 hypothetical protein BU25DRAFT_166423 [Macroventuria anomochaeta]